ncbi:BTB/POZ domain-containing protein 6-like [Oratosquilla oratoria]|uniref:BTB/POZ domain-containing protein 6-like n=1 Tax=Oratosquilla oratoria TaxID=337810 RepID=UPI003F77041C
MVDTGTLRFKKWQSMLKNGKERMQYLYTSSKLSDLDIFFPDDEEPIKVHSLILSTNSPVFFAMLNGPQAPDKLTLPEDPRHSFQKLLDHMYLDRVDLESVEEALKVYALAHKYEIESTKKECVKYIASNVKAETMPAVLETSVLYEDAAVKKKCKEILDRDPDAVMLPETVSRLSKKTLRALLTDKTLAFSSEAVPFRGLIAWGKAQLGQQEEPSGSALREEIGDDLLREVRFLDMFQDEFVDNVVGTDVLRGIFPKGLLSRFHLSPDGDRETLEPQVRYGLIPWLRSDRNICVHRLDAPGAGTLEIEDFDGGNVVISSTSSEGLEFVFAPPVALERGKRYNVWFTPKTEVVANGSDGGSQRVGNVTLSREWEGIECALYACESRSSGCGSE